MLCQCELKPHLENPGHYIRRHPLSGNAYAFRNRILYVFEARPNGTNHDCCTTAEDLCVDAEVDQAQNETRRDGEPSTICIMLHINSSGLLTEYSQTPKLARAMIEKGM